MSDEGGRDKGKLKELRQHLHSCGLFDGKIQVCTCGVERSAKLDGLRDEIAALRAQLKLYEGEGRRQAALIDSLNDDLATTKRDVFAGLAMAGFLVGSVICGREIGDGPRIARTAYAMADAMIEERGKERDEERDK